MMTDEHITPPPHHNQRTKQVPRVRDAFDYDKLHLCFRFDTRW